MYEEDEYPQEAEFDHGVTLNADIHVGWSNAAVIEAVIKQVSDLIYQDIKPKVIEAVTNALEDSVNKAMSEVFDREVQPTDRWGKPIGGPISIRAMLQRDAEKWLAENVDSKGRKGSDAYGSKHPRIHWLFEEALNGPRNFRGKTMLHKMVIEQVKEVIGDITTTVEATVRKQARAALGLK